MARSKSNSVNVSAAIRDYLRTSPDASPSTASAELTRLLGKKISPSYVSNIKSQLAKGKKKAAPKKKQQRRATITQTPPAIQVVIGTIVSLKDLLKTTEPAR
jgi:uncharacterized protein (DUF2267 family)